MNDKLSLPNRTLACLWHNERAPFIYLAPLRERNLERVVLKILSLLFHIEAFWQHSYGQ